MYHNVAIAVIFLRIKSELTYVPQEITQNNILINKILGYSTKKIGTLVRLICICQTDLKSLILYSSVAHLLKLP